MNEKESLALIEIRYWFRHLPNWFIEAFLNDALVEWTVRRAAMEGLTREEMLLQVAKALLLFRKAVMADLNRIATEKAAESLDHQEIRETELERQREREIEKAEMKQEIFNDDQAGNKS